MSPEERLKKLKQLRALKEAQEEQSRQQEPEVISASDTGMGALGKFAQGATFGFYDELRGLASAATGGDYKTGKESALSELEAYGEQHPGISLGTEIAGGLMTAIPLGAAGAATKAGQAISRLPNILKHGIYGGSGGAVAGTGYAEEGETLEGAGQGALIGGTLGATLPVAAWMGGVAKKPFEWAGKVMSSAKSRALSKLDEALGRDTITPEKLAANLRKMGPDATLADAAGENVLGLADAAVQTPGQTRNQAIAALNRRQAGQRTRVMDSLTDTVGDEKNFYKMLDDIGESLNTKSAPLYGEAFQANQDMTSKVIDRILKTPAGRKALAGARERMQNKMATMGQVDKELTEQLRFLQSIDKMEKVTIGGMKDIGVSSGLKLRTLDFIKQEMDDMINSTKRLLATGKARRGEYSDLIALKNKLVKELDDLDVTARAGPRSLKPEGGAYARARKVYAGDAKNKQALENGRKFFREDVEITQDMLSKMADSEKEYFRGGAMRAIRDKIESAPDSSDAYKRIFNNVTIRKKIRSLFPDNKSYAQFARLMKTESIFYKTRATVTGGSQTAKRLAQEADLGIDKELMSGAVLSPEYATARAGIRTLQKKLGLPEEVMNELGPMLFSNDPNVQRKILADLLRKGTPSLQSTRGQLSRGLRLSAPGATVEAGGLTQ